ncbi:exodeoxyribonuclease VII large subunit [Bacillus marinisedimentorum]|uniref:exodeoxyribonuclease VII large subunit n=1 Tax=Bacillus marinisedimentorum TaxID=1821260 RepID=UPI0008720479|nr:exodeoxyribonuclease VII large subunit [Bacillus marinisedimentorum]
MSEQRFLTVTALTRYIKRKFETDRHLKDIWFKGEISNFKLHNRGHMYFTIKDEQSRIAAVMFAGQNRQLAFKPENGMKILVRGQISVYEPMGSYQVYVKEMQPDGLGSLYLAYEELKKKLEAEGLFKPERKKPIPAVPSYVGVITSPTGAAVRDIFTTIKRRFPVAGIVLFPVLVQGKEAAPSIASAIRKANENEFLDVLIVGRGGGSIEDLWAFNEEVVAREISASRLPVISAVGHETDFTIADFTADLRAPTPTAAAELAVPHLNELAERVKERQMRLFRSVKELAGNRREQLNRLQKSYAFKYPGQMLIQKEQELDRMMERLDRSFKYVHERKSENFKQLDNRLARQHPREHVLAARENYENTRKSLMKEFRGIFEDKQAAFQQGIAQLNALNPLRVMERGFSVVYREDRLVKSVQSVKAGDSIQIKMHDGQLGCQVSDIKEGDGE